MTKTDRLSFRQCVFCRIVSGQMPAAVIWQDKNQLAILDNQPNVKGMALVMTKRHYPSYAFQMPAPAFQRLLAAARIVGRKLDRTLGTKRTALVMEGLGLDHVHIKLYPIPGLAKTFDETWARRRVYFKKYQGYLTTQLGPKRPNRELMRLADKIRSIK